METFKAEVVERDKEQCLMLVIKGQELIIPLTKDEPNEIKMVFNSLILQLKKSPFQISIEDREDGDIFHNIAREYINQLNTELDAIRKELEAHSLVEELTVS
jgi:hypothetical protein